MNHIISWHASRCIDCCARVLFIMQKVSDSFHLFRCRAVFVRLAEKPITQLNKSVCNKFRDSKFRIANCCVKNTPVGIELAFLIYVVRLVTTYATKRILISSRLSYLSFDVDAYMETITIA